MRKYKSTKYLEIEVTRFFSSSLHTQHTHTTHSHTTHTHATSRVIVVWVAVVCCWCWCCAIQATVSTTMPTLTDSFARPYPYEINYSEEHALTNDDFTDFELKSSRPLAKSSALRASYNIICTVVGTGMVCCFDAIALRHDSDIDIGNHRTCCGSESNQPQPMQCPNGSMAR
jgi:hypothetical protein